MFDTLAPASYPAALRRAETLARRPRKYDVQHLEDIFRQVLTACIWYFIPGCLSFRICSIIPAVASPSCRSSAPCRRSKSPERSSAMLSRLEHKRLRRYKFRTTMIDDTLQVYAPNASHDLMSTYTVLIPRYRTMVTTLPIMLALPLHSTT